MWVDSHCHLQLADRPAADLLAAASGVDWLVVPGIDAATSRAALELSARFPLRVVATAGLHPHGADDWPVEQSELLEMGRRAAAIGEIGLDFYRNLSSRAGQIAAFTEQLLLAVDLEKPAVVHCRDAFREIYDIIESTGTGERVVMHCWTGGTRWTRRFLDLGVMISFAGPIAFETGDTVRRAADLVPPDRVMIETDTPYLSPPPHRGEPNEPARVALVGEALARRWEAGVEEVARVTSENAGRVFRP